MPVTISDIETAAKHCRDKIVRTPCSLSHPLTERTGAKVYVKYENKQFTSSFKVRGALAKLATLSEKQMQLGVVSMSAGNHAQGVAYNSRRLGIPATIIMPDSTPFTKIRRTKSLGAETLIKGSNLKESEDYAKALANSHGLTFIHPFNDMHVIAGQGTVALEMLTDIPDLDTLVVPVGGGGLVGGTIVAAKSLNPSIRIVGVEAEKYPSLTNAVNGTALPCSGSTLAEGIAVTEIGDIPLSLINGNIDEVFVVSESTIEQAVAMFTY